jgi:manganese/zinc/iron transport system permease protein
MVATMWISPVERECRCAEYEYEYEYDEREVEMTFPTFEQFRAVLLLEDYNTRVVVASVAVLGVAAGLVGSFTLLRKRALLGDALAHASLPGIAIAFMLTTGLGGEGKSLPILLLGASLGGLVGVGFILVVQNYTRLKQDAVLGIVLSVFFGFGAALLGIIQQMRAGSAAGLETFIYGKTASIKQDDALLIFAVASLCILMSGLLFKELKLLCFDQDFSDASGLSTAWLDIALMGMVVAVTMVGLQAVGLILVVALLVIPPAAARFWTQSLFRMALLAAVFGLSGGVLGAATSAVLPRLPSGAMIVLVTAAIFLASMAIGKSRGLIPRELRRRALNRRIDRQHLLRALYELLERQASVDGEASGTSPQVFPRDRAVSFQQLLDQRSWSAPRLRKIIAALTRENLVRGQADQIKLTGDGYSEAVRLTRQHRLWELYLIHHAEVAPARVDRDADAIEHVLEPELVDELERLLDASPLAIAVPASPHVMEPVE